MSNHSSTVTRPDRLETLRLKFLDDRSRPPGGKLIEMMDALKARMKASKPIAKGEKT